ncbi:peptide ABC transporter substrate-binding protein [Clostridium swellfunianum]|uniref:peptide ABC transporter substrate-binding protein n=1 Tax=Clostridium swellfunianum TaxID=1367462 RepID=UPI00202E10D7|nr:peptide ABC transporter substrate-binding protein [Clostridium swellfunianum]MCM0650737.1 peptide ABC transporter substrate-binding protein [Clostridium swellfunianum]
MKKLVLLATTFIFLISTGCVEKKVNNISQYNKTDDYLVYNIGSMPENLILLDDSKIRNKDIMISLFEGLVKTDENGDIVPGLAESWTIGNDNITYTFKLRESAYWSDGTPITSEDFKSFFKDILNSKQSNIFAYQLYSIFGAQEYRENKKAFNGVAIRSVDSKTLEIRLNSPTSYFLEILSQPIYTLRKLGSNLKDWKNSYSEIVYSGPFIIDTVSKDGEVSLIKNEYYYDMNEVKSERIYLTSSQGSENSLALFKTNKINLFINPPLSESGELVLDGEAEVVPIEGGASLNFNFKKAGIISNSNFRQSISLAIDRDGLLSGDLNYIARSASAYVPNDTGSVDESLKFKPLIKVEGNEEQSKKLLRESKYDKKERLKIVYLNNNENRRLCDALVKNIKENLDISLDYKGYNDIELQDVLKSGDYDMMIMNYALLYDDPASILESWASNSKLNIFGYKNAEFDSLISKAKFENDKAKRKDLLKRAEEIFLSDAPAIPIYFHNIILCKKSSVQDVYATKEGNIKLDRAYIEK